MSYFIGIFIQTADLIKTKKQQQHHHHQQNQMRKAKLKPFKVRQPFQLRVENRYFLLSAKRILDPNSQNAKKYEEVSYALLLSFNGVVVSCFGTRSFTITDLLSSLAGIKIAE